MFGFGEPEEIKLPPKKLNLTVNKTRTPSKSPRTITPLGRQERTDSFRSERSIGISKHTGKPISSIKKAVAANFLFSNTNNEAKSQNVVIKKSNQSQIKHPVPIVPSIKKELKKENILKQTKIQQPNRRIRASTDSDLSSREDIYKKKPNPPTKGIISKKQQQPKIISDKRLYQRHISTSSSSSTSFEKPTKNVEMISSPQQSESVNVLPITPRRPSNISPFIKPVTPIPSSPIYSPKPKRAEPSPRSLPVLDNPKFENIENVTVFTNKEDFTKRQPSGIFDTVYKSLGLDRLGSTSQHSSDPYDRYLHKLQTMTTNESEPSPQLPFKTDSILSSNLDANKHISFLYDHDNMFNINDNSSLVKEPFVLLNANQIRPNDQDPYYSYLDRVDKIYANARNNVSLIQKTSHPTNQSKLLFPLDLNPNRLKNQISREVDSGFPDTFAFPIIRPLTQLDMERATGTLSWDNIYHYLATTRRCRV